MGKVFLITAGGMKERIDEVRSIVNSSKGTLGMTVADAILLQDKVEVEKIFYLYGPNAVLPADNPLIEFYPIENALELEVKLKEILTQNTVDYAIHAMAVADYRVESILTPDNLLTGDGIKSDKVSSTHDELYLKLVKNPKVIDQIKQLSPRTFLVGFKLLHSATDDELFEVGFKLLRRTRANMVLANDLAQIRSGQPHRGLLIYPEKHSDIIEGGKEAIADRIISTMLRRGEVRYPRSVQIDNFAPSSVEDQMLILKECGQSLEKGLLPEIDGGTYGNMSVRLDKGFLITGRGVDKRELNLQRVCLIENTNQVLTGKTYLELHYKGMTKPSIDSAIHSMIYKSQPVDSILHIHDNALYEGISLTNNNHPCGSSLEADSICELLTGDDQFVVQMHKHGLIIGADNLDTCKELLGTLKDKLHLKPLVLNEQTAPVIAEWNQHRNEVIGNATAKLQMFDERLMRVIMFEQKPIGVTWYQPAWQDGKWVGEFYLYVIESMSKGGHGFGKRVVSLIEQLAIRDNCEKLRLLTRPGCNVEVYYQDKLGFEMADSIGDLISLERKIK